MTQVQVPSYPRTRSRTIARWQLCRLVYVPGYPPRASIRKIHLRQRTRRKGAVFWEASGDAAARKKAALMGIGDTPSGLPWDCDGTEML